MNQVLEAKRAALARGLRITYSQDVLQFSPRGRVFQVDTPQPLAAYPAPGAAPIEIARYVVPSGMRAVLTALAIVHIGAAASYLDGSPAPLWHVLRNGAGVQSLENLYSQIGTLAQPQPMSVILVENDILQVLVEIPAAAVAPVGNPYARFVGFLDVGGQGTRPPASSGARGGASTTTPATPTSAPAGSGGGSAMPSGYSSGTDSAGIIGGNAKRFPYVP
jgi:hypothetical protein